MKIRPASFANRLSSLPVQPFLPERLGWITWHRFEAGNIPRFESRCWLRWSGNSVRNGIVLTPFRAELPENHWNSYTNSYLTSSQMRPKMWRILGRIIRHILSAMRGARKKGHEQIHENAKLALCPRFIRRITHCRPPAAHMTAMAPQPSADLRRVHWA